MDTNYEIGDLRKKIAGELEEILNDNKNKPVDVLTIREKYIYRAIRGHLLPDRNKNCIRALSGFTVSLSVPSSDPCDSGSCNGSGKDK